MNSETFYTIPILEQDAAILPGETRIIRLTDSRSIDMIEHCLRQKWGDAEFGVVSSVVDDFPWVGCTAGIIEVVDEGEAGEVRVLCQGLSRFSVLQTFDHEPFPSARVEMFCDDSFSSSGVEFELLLERIERLQLHVDSSLPIDDVSDAKDSFSLAAQLGLENFERQQLLDSRSEETRLSLIRDMIAFRAFAEQFGIIPGASVEWEASRTLQ